MSAATGAAGDDADAPEHQAPGRRLRWFVPGRIEVLGKHTDYAGGRSLICAVERGFCVTAVPRDDDVLRIVDVVNRVEAMFRVRADQAEETRWRRYIATVARRVARNFPPSRAGVAGGEADEGCDVDSEVEVEVDAHVSVNAGAGADGYSPPRVEQVVALPAGLTFLIGSSGVAAEKTGAARDDYNRASQAVAAVLDHWRAVTGSAAAEHATLYDIVAAGAGEPATRESLTHDVGASNVERLRRVLAGSHDPRFSPEALIARLDHFVREALEIIPQATTALARGDLSAFGALVDESQAAAERWLANQIPETIALARLARAQGAIAASSFGAGFGGSVWALVRTDDTDAFLANWQRTYLAQFPAHADRVVFFATAPGPPRSSV